MLNLLKRFQWPIVSLAIVSAAAYVVVVGFGDALGIDPQVKSVIEDVLANIRNLAATSLLPLLLQDKNNNGIFDLLEEEDIVSFEDSDSA